MRAYLQKVWSIFLELWLLLGLDILTLGTLRVNLGMYRETFYFCFLLGPPGQNIGQKCVFLAWAAQNKGKKGIISFVV